MSSQDELAPGADRLSKRWFEIRRLAAGAMEAQMELGDEYLTHLTFIFKGYEVMCVMKAVRGDAEKLVAFHSAVDLEAALWGSLSKLAGGNVKWKKDTPWKPKKGK